MNRLAVSSLRGLLSRPDAQDLFNQRVSQLESIRLVDEGVPRRERKEEKEQKRLIRSFHSLRHRLAKEGGMFQPGDSAVLVPLVELSEDQEPWALFTRRSHRMRTHRGEVSFPGGHRVDENEDVEQTALREAHEEIGLEAADIRLWGRLPSLLTRHNKNVVTPVVGVIAEAALKRLIVGTEEVHSVFIAPIAELAESESYTAFRVGSDLYRMPIYKTKRFQLLTTDQEVDEPPTHEHRVWGLTGGILSELLAALLNGKYLIDG